MSEICRVFAPDLAGSETIKYRLLKAIRGVVLWKESFSSEAKLCLPEERKN